MQQGEEAAGLYDVQSDSNTASLGIEDSGFGSGGSVSWNFTKPTADAELHDASDEYTKGGGNFSKRTHVYTVGDTKTFPFSLCSTLRIRAYYAP